MGYIIWDWNGTLLDDVTVCVDVMNAMLSKRGLPGLDVGRYREIFTFPVRDYYQAAGLDFSKEPFEALAQEYIQAYNQLALSQGLYPGAREVLAGLSAAGCRQLIASASETSALRAQTTACGVTDLFEALLGVDDVLGSGKEGLARRYLLAQGAVPGEAVFIGDTLHDWEVAQALGCSCLLIAQGHQSRDRLAAAGVPVLDSIRQVPGCLAALC